jgi:DnaJ-domain-containing protein 1
MKRPAGPTQRPSGAREAHAAPGTSRAPEAGRSAAAGRPHAWEDRDYTADVIEFLKETHGNIRRDAQGDYFYNSVSTISLHFLLQSKLPAQEVLWRWYLYFDRGRSESIYRTIPPQDDEQFLAILGACDFRWDGEAVRESGLMFLRQHRAEAYLAIDEFLNMRMDAFRTMSDAELRGALTPKLTWSEVHLRKMIRRIQTQPLSPDQRHAVYGLFESDYIRATARHLIDEAATEAFWKAPPAELEALNGQFHQFARQMSEAAHRLGVYLSRDAFERLSGQRFRQEFGDFSGSKRGAGGGRPGGYRPSTTAVDSQFAVLGLALGATLQDVKAAYRDKVKQHHPDQGGEIQAFLRLQEAYEFLLTQVF